MFLGSDFKCGKHCRYIPRVQKLLGLHNDFSEWKGCWDYEVWGLLAQLRWSLSGSWPSCSRESLLSFMLQHCFCISITLPKSHITSYTCVFLGCHVVLMHIWYLGLDEWNAWMNGWMGGSWCPHWTPSSDFCYWIILKESCDSCGWQGFGHTWLLFTC